VNAPELEHLVDVGDAAEDLARIRADRAAAAEIRTAEQRLDAWAIAACSEGAGGSNVITVDAITYSWDARPRRLQNGALQGRVYAQARGETPRDIGGFKIDGRGRVVHLPRELAGVLPGAEAPTSEEAP
jgi:hypothetical protein